MQGFTSLSLRPMEQACPTLSSLHQHCIHFLTQFMELSGFPFCPNLKKEIRAADAGKAIKYLIYNSYMELSPAFHMHYPCKVGGKVS